MRWLRFSSDAAGQARVAGGPMTHEEARAAVVSTLDFKNCQQERVVMPRNIIEEHSMREHTHCLVSLCFAAGGAHIFGQYAVS